MLEEEAMSNKNELTQSSETGRADVAEALAADQVKAIHWTRTFASIMTVAAVLSMSYAVGVTVGSWCSGSAIKADVVRIEKSGTEQSRINSADIIHLQEQFRSIAVQLDEIKGMLREHIRQDRSQAFVGPAVPDKL